MTDSRHSQNNQGEPHRIARRRFLGNSVLGSLATGVLQGVAPISLVDIFLPDGSKTVELKIVGEEREGYGVTLTYDGKTVARHNAGGEFSAIFQNGDRSLEDRIENWKATSWKGDA